MKFVRVTGYYQNYLEIFSKLNPVLSSMDYSSIRARLDEDGFGLADFWTHAMRPLGYEGLEVTFNYWPLQKAWVYESGINSLIDKVNSAKDNPTQALLHEIAINQVRQFQPDILFFQHSDFELLLKLKNACNSIKMFLGWTGSAVFHPKIVTAVDLMLSCSPETVAFLSAQGAQSHHIDHAFDSRILGRVSDKRVFDVDFSFTGQIQLSRDFHIQRAVLLETLAKQLPLQVFTDAKFVKRTISLKQRVKNGGAFLLSGLPNLGLSPEKVLQTFPNLRKFVASEEDYNVSRLPKLKPESVQAPVYGMEMFQLLKDSGISLNIHADSSPQFASNIRLFEATGVGGCLLTDWKENIHQLFVPDFEVVTYKSLDECHEKARWLLNNPEQRRAIGLAAKMRVSKEHNYQHRALHLDRIVREFI